MRHAGPHFSTVPTRRPALQHLAAAAAAVVVAAGACVPAGAQVVPVFVASESTAAADHRPNVNLSTGRQATIAYSNGSATLKAPYNPSTLTFPGGSTVAKAGLGRSQTTTRTQVTFASGTGVSQNDPNHTQAASVLVLTFTAEWGIFGGSSGAPLPDDPSVAFAGSSFGPPLGSTFSVPIGAQVNTQGSASFFCDVHWHAIDGGVRRNDVRAPYTTTRNFGPGTTLTSVTAPAAPFNISAVGDGGSVIMTGVLIFQVNNDDGPALIEIPTLENFPELAARPDLQYEPRMTFDGEEVPEPSSAVAGTASLVGLLLARRRRTV